MISFLNEYMNYAMIRYFIGAVSGIEGLLMLIPLITALLYKEKSGLFFLLVIAMCTVLYLLLARKKPKNSVFYAKEGFVTVSLCWIILSVIGSLPFYLSHEIPSFVDALFETVSGFTTTGASVLSNVESLSHCMLLWRSFTHWIGGMGVLVFILAVMPMSGGYTMHVLRAESPGPSVGKLVPNIKKTALILYVIYFFLTIIEFICLLISGMNCFDSFAMALGTAGTGGFGIVNDSCGSYTYAQQTILTIFMLLFGVNFNIYYLFLTKRGKDAMKGEELRIYLFVVVISSILIGINAQSCFSTFRESLHHATFTVASLITTTGFSTADFDLWPTFSKTLLLSLMFLGACAGSTCGGMKISRWAIAYKSVKMEIYTMLHPNAVASVRFEGKAVGRSVIRSIYSYMIGFAILYVISMLVISFDNFDLETNFTAVAATINNIGPGLGKVGPTCNFGIFSSLSKIMLMFDMLVGRLELYPMLILVYPETWRRS